MKKILCYILSCIVCVSGLFVKALPGSDNVTKPALELLEEE